MFLNSDNIEIKSFLELYKREKRREKTYFPALRNSNFFQADKHEKVDRKSEKNPSKSSVRL